MNLWPPFLGSGIRVTRVDRNLKAIDVEMNLHLWNSNYFGTHFGGALYMMTDPFFVLMLLENLGSSYVIWDKVATIRFRKPGRKKVRVEFRLSGEALDNIVETLNSVGTVEPIFSIDVTDETGIVVAEVEKTLYVCKRK